MTLKELTVERYNMYANRYVRRATDFRLASQEAGQWRKPKIKKHWLFLMRMTQFYIDNSKGLLNK